MKIHKLFVFFIVIYYLFFPYSAQAIENNVIDKQYFNDHYWSLLLHYKNGESEIDDSSFFLSKTGKHNKEDELNATINDLLSSNGSSYCNFPARRNWLLKVIPGLKDKVKPRTCAKFDKFLSDMQGDSITLIFPSSHLNSPASMFGHTLFRVDRRNENSLISNAVNYAAFTQETNGLIFAYKGLFGGYEGRYSLTPYYDKIKEYSALENRDIWEYKLNLSPLEVKILLTHLYEIKDTYSWYYFFSENCSYAILWLLEIARPSVKLVEKFNHVTTPLSTIREIKINNMIANTSFRPSKRRFIKHIIKDKLTHKSAPLEFESKNYDPAYLEQYSIKERAYILDIVINRWQYKRSQNKIDNKQYLKTFLKLLRQRSQQKTSISYDIKKSVDPLEGHYLTRLGLDVNQTGTLNANLRLGYHDIYDLDYAFKQGAYINFLDLDIEKPQNKNLRIKKIDVLNIQSYSIRTDYFKPISWSVATGAKLWKDSEFHAYLDLGAGLSYGYDNNMFIFMLQASAYAGKYNLAGIGAKTGLISNYFNKTKLVILAKNQYFNANTTELDLEFFINRQITKQTNMQLRLNKNTFKEPTIQIGIVRYFNY